MVRKTQNFLPVTEMLHWQAGFEATLEQSGQATLPVTLLDVAKIWLRITGVALEGFEQGFFDYVEALGLDVIDKVFNTQGRLGL